MGLEGSRISMAKSVSGKVTLQSEEMYLVWWVTSQTLGTGNALLQLGVNHLGPFWCYCSQAQ